MISDTIDIVDTNQILGFAGIPVATVVYKPAQYILLPMLATSMLVEKGCRFVAILNLSFFALFNVVLHVLHFLNRLSLGFL